VLSWRVFLLLLLLAHGADAAVLSLAPVSNGDDAEEILATGAVRSNGSDLHLGHDGTASMAVGLRYAGVAIPAGAVILSAYVQFSTDERSRGATTLEISGEASDQAAPFTATPGNISSRARLPTRVGWAVPPWNSRREAGPDQRTPDLALIVQEIVSRPGWRAGNALVLIIEPGPGCLPRACSRIAEARTGASPGAPRLVIDYLAAPPAIEVAKTSEVVLDPHNGSVDPKRIPGATVMYTIEVINRGAGPADADTLLITDAVPANTALVVTDIGSAGSGPVAFLEGNPASGLTYLYGGLGSAGDSLEFSNDGGASFGYTPSAGADGTDPDVTHVRVRPVGAMAADPLSHPRFRLRFRVMVL
jgi:uncharacterized repeat protein (TIGR01451 family)